MAGRRPATAVNTPFWPQAFFSPAAIFFAHVEPDRPSSLNFRLAQTRPEHKPQRAADNPGTTGNPWKSGDRANVVAKGQISTAKFADDRSNHLKYIWQQTA
jgi:hypothetical protein